MNTDDLARLLAKKHDCLAQLHQLASRQASLIEREEMTSLLSLLSAKQQLLGELYEVNHALSPWRNDDIEQRQWRSPALRVRCRELADGCESLLRETLEIERGGEALLASRRDAVSARLQRAWEGSQSLDCYTQNAAQNASRLDLYSEG